MPRSTSIILTLLAIGVLASPAFAQCPESTVSVIARDLYNTVLFEASDASAAPSAQVSYGRKTRASYDRLTRTVDAAAYVYLDEAYSHSSRASVVDRFELVGASTAVIAIRLTLDEYVLTDPSFRMAWVWAIALLKVNDQTARAETTISPFLDPYIELTAVVHSNEPIDVTYEVSVDGWGYGPVIELTGQLEFIELPDGAQLVPCDSVVPVKTTTWGMVKALYRE